MHTYLVDVLDPIVNDSVITEPHYTFTRREEFGVWSWPRRRPDVGIIRVRLERSSKVVWSSQFHFVCVLVFGIPHCDTIVASFMAIHSHIQCWFAESCYKRQHRHLMRYDPYSGCGRYFYLVNTTYLCLICEHDRNDSGRTRPPSLRSCINCSARDEHSTDRSL